MQVNRDYLPALMTKGWNGFTTLKTWASEVDVKAAQEKVLTDLGVKSGNADANGTGKAEIFYDGSNGSTINGGGGNDIVFGGGGNDTLNGEKLAMSPLWALRRKLESPVVIPAQAGIQWFRQAIPASAGMTKWWK